MNKLFFALLIVLAFGSTVLLIGCSKDSDNPTDIPQLQKELERQKKLFATLEATISSLNGIVAMLESQLLQNTVNIGAIENDLAILESQIMQLNLNQTALQLQHISLLGQLAELQGYVHIVGFVDPCGDAPGVLDEVLLRLSNGQILASVSDNGNAMRVRFGFLSNGNYSSTDGTSCAFTVQNRVVTW